jgi:hypothetical protein
LGILITAASTTKAHQLKIKLNIPNIVLGDFVDLPEFLLKSGSMIKLANPNSENYIHLMLSFCLDNNITGIYPLRELEFNKLNEAKQLFEEYGIELFKV